MPRKPNATRPNANIGVAKANSAGSNELTATLCEKRYDANINTIIASPIQKADMFPATKPERIFSEAPPCFEQLVTSRTWREFVLTNTFVNSGIIAPATVPQLIMIESTHHNAG